MIKSLPNMSKYAVLGELASVPVRKCSISGEAQWTVHYEFGLAYSLLPIRFRFSVNLWIFRSGCGSRVRDELVIFHVPTVSAVRPNNPEGKSRRNAEMIEILHVIRQLSCDGFSRALIGEARYSSLLGDFRHRVISLLAPESMAVGRASAAGLNVLAAPDKSTILREMERADIVQVGWWNNPELSDLLRSELPAARLLVRLNVAGDNAPQMVTPELAAYADYFVPTISSSCQLQVFRHLPSHGGSRNLTSVHSGPELDHLLYLVRKPHSGFNVGCISDGYHAQLHPRYVAMSAAIGIPDARFILHGGSDCAALREQVRQSRVGERFEYRSSAEDIRPLLEILDVYGCPVSEDSYVSADHRLEEVMAAGLPAVVFPHGGLGHLVVNEYTGLVVGSELEYRQAIEQLYHDHEERLRLGRNAREYARQMLGAGNAAKKLNRVYETLMTNPKRNRAWGASAFDAGAGRLSFRDLFESRENPSGAQMFIDSLGEEGGYFVKSMTSSSDDELFDADRRIASRSSLMHSASSGGVMAYRDHYPGDCHLRFWAGLILQQQGEYSQAASELAQAARLGFNHWRIHWYLAQLAEKLGDVSFVREALDKVLRAAPNFPEAKAMSLRYGSSIERQGSASRSQDVRQSLDWSFAQSSVSAAAKSPLPEAGRDSLASLAYQKIQPLIKAGSRTEAIEGMEKLVEWYPGFALVHNDLGVLYSDEKDGEKALAHYEEAVRLDPENTTFLKNLADFYYVAEGRTEDAMRLYVKILAANPEDLETLLVIGGICEALEKYDDAKHFYTRALEIEPWSSDARQRLDTLLDYQHGVLDSGHDKDDGNESRGAGMSPECVAAIDELEKALRSYGQSSFVDPVSAKYENAQELVRGGKPDEAISVLEDLLTDDSRFALAHNDLGVLYCDCGKREEALRHYEIAADIDPGNPTFRKNLADFYYVQQAETEKAMRIYVGLLSEYPRDTELLLTLGKVCLDLEKFEDGKTFYERVLEIDALNEIAAQNLEVIRQWEEDGAARERLETDISDHAGDGLSGHVGETPDLEADKGSEMTPPADATKAGNGKEVAEDSCDTPESHALHQENPLQRM
jgi:tetratricopeptide (TPR) repeat protein